MKLNIFIYPVQGNEGNIGRHIYYGSWYAANDFSRPWNKYSVHWKDSIINFHDFRFINDEGRNLIIRLKEALS